MRALRKREGLTLNQLADRSGLSHGRISRIERGRAEVSLQALMRLSAALGVEVTYFTSYQDAVSQTEKKLREALAAFDVSPETTSSFLRLSFDAQGLLLDGLRRLSRADAESPIRARELVDRILDQGVAASIREILAGIPKFGIDMETFCRVVTQMEEQRGDRLIMSDRMLSVTTPNGGQIDGASVYRSIFQAEPGSLEAVKLWVQTVQSAVNQSVERDLSRTIYSIQAIDHYITSGHWGRGVDVDGSVVHRHVDDLIRTIRTMPNFHVGLADMAVPFGLLVKGSNQVLVHIRRDPDIHSDADQGVAFRSTRPDVTRRFRAYFDSVWNGIPDEFKDDDAVAKWLEQRLARVSR